MKFTAAAVTDLGLVRAHNEDCYVFAEAAGVFAVADGVGGHPGGDVAARVAVDAFLASLLASARTPQSVALAMQVAHRAVRRAAVERRVPGASTTLVALVATPTGAVVAHVGDSRAYLRRAADGAFLRLTVDHAHGGFLTRAVGAEPTVRPEVASVALAPGDAVLLCSDGVWGSVSAERLGQHLYVATQYDLAVALAGVLGDVREAGAPDNATALIARVAG